MLEVERLSGGYGKVDVLDKVSLHVGKGECVALLGPNGAGKSTLMAALTATLPHRAGAYRLDGADVMRARSDQLVASGVALTPEGRRIFAPFSVRDNLRLGAIALAGRATAAERFDYALSLFPRLRERINQRAGSLSGGEQQMLAIGRALMSAPRLLLLDEPFLGLAPMIVEEILAVLARLRADGLTILLVEQKIDMALANATRAYVLIKGRIVLESDTGALAKRGDLADLYFSLAGEGGQPRI